MKKWTINQLVLTGYLAAVLFLALLAIITWQSMMTSTRLTNQALHSKLVLLASEKINSSVSLAFATHSSYLLNEDHVPLIQHDAAVEQLHAAVLTLVDLAGEDRQLQAYVKQVQQVVPDLIPNIKLSRALTSAKQLQDILSKISAHELQLQKHYAKLERDTLRRTQITAALLLVLLILLLAALYIMIRRQEKNEQSHMALEKNEALLRQILELLPVGVLVVGHDSTLHLANPAAHDIWGTASEGQLQAPLGKTIEHLEPSALRALQHGEITLDYEYEMIRDDGQHRWLRSSAMPLRDSTQQIIGAIVVKFDLTDLKHADKALQAAHDALEARVAMRTRELVVANTQLRSQIEERRRAEDALRQTQNVLTIAQRVAHVASWEINTLTEEAQWSDEFFRICGLEPGSIKPSIPAGFTLIHPDDRRMISRIVGAAIKTQQKYSAIIRVVRPDASIRHVRLQGEPVSNSKAAPSIFIGSMLDITEQVQNEELLRELALHQQVIKEEERKRIAREIHDEMGQNLMALRIDVSMLHARTANSHPRLHHKVETVLVNIDHTIKSVRSIINDLRPAVLDLGLHATLQWQIQEFERRTGIACDLFAKIDELDQGLSEEQTTTLFRILQESLTNVARHANASCVNVALQRKGKQLEMRISDDGVGMYPGDRRKSKSFGLLGIRERVSAIGGELIVDSVIGQGTLLLITIPLAYIPDFNQARSQLRA